MRRVLALLLLAACTGDSPETGAPPEDLDGDGHAGDADCDEGDPAVYLGAGERCNGADDDCDGVVDPDWATDAPLWYGDADADGYGIPADQRSACAAPEGYADNPDDCDDASAAVSPAAAELCNGLDDDCDGVTDPASAADAASWHPDGDQDGFGSVEATATACSAPAGFLADGSDCDDGDAAVHPAAADAPGDGVDQDCWGGDLTCADVDLHDGVGEHAVEPTGDDLTSTCAAEGVPDVAARWVAPADGTWTFTVDAGVVAILGDAGTCGGEELACGAAAEVWLAAGEGVVLVVEAPGPALLTVAAE